MKEAEKMRLKTPFLPPKTAAGNMKPKIDLNFAKRNPKTKLPSISKPRTNIVTFDTKERREQPTIPPAGRKNEKQQIPSKNINKAKSIIEKKTRIVESDIIDETLEVESESDDNKAMNNSGIADDIRFFGPSGFTEDRNAQVTKMLSALAHHANGAAGVISGGKNSLSPPQAQGPNKIYYDEYDDEIRYLATVGIVQPLRSNFLHNNSPLIHRRKGAVSSLSAFSSSSSSSPSAYSQTQYHSNRHVQNILMPRRAIKSEGDTPEVSDILSANLLVDRPAPVKPTAPIIPQLDDSLNKLKGGYGNKQEQSVLKRLNAKIELVRDDSSWLKKTEQLAAERDRERAGRMADALIKRKEEVSQSLPEKKLELIYARAAVQESHVRQVQEKKVKLDQELYEEKSTYGIRKQKEKEERIRKKMELEELRQRCRSWMVCVYLTQAAEWSKQKLDDDLQAKIAAMRRKHAANVLQRKLYPKVCGAKREKARMALAVLRRNMLFFVMHIRIMRKKKAADIVRNVLKAIAESQTASRYIRLFRVKVIRIQRAIRAYLRKNRARIYTLCQAWRRVELDLLIEKQDEINAKRAAILAARHKAQEQHQQNSSAAPAKKKAAAKNDPKQSKPAPAASPYGKPVISVTKAASLFDSSAPAIPAAASSSQITILERSGALLSVRSEGSSDASSDGENESEFEKEKSLLAHKMEMAKKTSEEAKKKPPLPFTSPLFYDKDVKQLCMARKSMEKLHIIHFTPDVTKSLIIKKWIRLQKKEAKSHKAQQAVMAVRAKTLLLGSVAPKDISTSIVIRPRWMMTYEEMRGLVEQHWNYYKQNLKKAEAAPTASSSPEKK